ncbi:hypothetical protein LTR40_009839, partial [Exophiala xenobiotica]
MGVLGGEPSVWETDLDARGGSFSISKIFGVSVSVTQKRRPQTSLKELILAKWKTAPQTANPGILNQYLGVEISHCTGNAQRVRIKDLLLMSTIRPLLEIHFPQWSSLPWGGAFLAALQSNDPEAVFEVWVTHQASRSEMAALVCYVLEILDKTGKREEGLAAAFLNKRHEYSITFDGHLNEWSSLLRDSHLMATYAVVNNLCIECHTPDHSTATCGGEAAYTVLGTRLGLGTGDNPELVKVQPHGQLCKTLERLDLKTLRMTPVSSAAFAHAYLTNTRVASGVEIRDATARAGQQYKIFLRASNTSYGGMKAARYRNQADQAGHTQRDIGTRLSRAPLGPGHVERRRSASTFRSADHEDVLPSLDSGLHVPGPSASTHIQSILFQDPGMSRAPHDLNPPIETTLTPNLTTPRLVLPTELDLPAWPDQRTPSLDRTMGGRLSNESSSADNVLRTLHPVVHGTNESCALRPSLLEDMRNYQVDDLEAPSGGAGLLHDINNYEINEDVETEAGPSTTRPTAPSDMSCLSGPNTDSSVAT